MDLSLFLRESTALANGHFFGGLGLDAAHEAQVSVELVLGLSLILGLVGWCKGHVHQLLNRQGLDLDFRGVHYKVSNNPIALGKVLEQVSLFLVSFYLTCLKEQVLAAHVSFLPILHNQGLRVCLALVKGDVDLWYSLDQEPLDVLVVPLDPLASIVLVVDVKQAPALEVHQNVHGRDRMVLVILDEVTQLVLLIRKHLEHCVLVERGSTELDQNVDQVLGGVDLDHVRILVDLHESDHAVVRMGSEQMAEG